MLSAAAPFFIEKAVQPQSVKVYGFPIRYPPLCSCSYFSESIWMELEYSEGVIPVIFLNCREK